MWTAAAQVRHAEILATAAEGGGQRRRKPFV
jgi:hypothetical protein